jgi:hypothetical protein
MAEHAIHPPIHLLTHPDEPIRSLEAAAKVIRRHTGDYLDRNSQDLLQEIKHTSTLQEADAAGKAFRAWGGSPRPAAGSRRKTENAPKSRSELGSLARDDAHPFKAHLRSRIDAIALTSLRA